MTGSESKAYKMAVARINIKNIDYFKFKKIVIDGNRDDYKDCSKEVRALCDHVQTLNFRDDEFDDISDRQRLEEICAHYKQIIKSKRIDSLDMRIKSGWWGDHKNAYSAGKIKPVALKDILVGKTKEWVSRKGISHLPESEIDEKIDGPGHFVFKQKEHQCFQFVGKADKIFARCGEKLKAAFEGNLQEPLAALLVISMASDWDFYFIPVDANDDERILRVLENDLILKHDCIWPHGLNFTLQINTLLEVSEFRKSCLRHDWPPDADSFDEPEIDLNSLRRQIEVGLMSDSLTPDSSVCGDSVDGGRATPPARPATRSPAKAKAAGKPPSATAPRPTTPRANKSSSARPAGGTKAASPREAVSADRTKRPTSAGARSIRPPAKPSLPRPQTPKKRSLPKPPPPTPASKSPSPGLSPVSPPEPLEPEKPEIPPPEIPPPIEPTPEVPVEETNGQDKDESETVVAPVRSRSPSPAGSTGSNRTFTVEKPREPSSSPPDNSMSSIPVA